MKRRITEKQKANLQTEKYKFTSDNPERAQKAQKKSVEKRHENKQKRIELESAANHIWQELGLDTVEQVKREGTLTQKIDLIKSALSKITQKQEITGNLEIQKIFISPEEHDATLKHIEDVINDKS